MEAVVKVFTVHSGECWTQEIVVESRLVGRRESLRVGWLGLQLADQRRLTPCPSHLPPTCPSTWPAEPNFSLPWQRKRQYSSSGSGFAIEGRRLLTNAHCVDHHTQVGGPLCSLCGQLSCCCCCRCLLSAAGDAFRAPAAIPAPASPSLAARAAGRGQAARRRHIRTHRPLLPPSAPPPVPLPLHRPQVKVKRRGSDTKYVAQVLAMGTECDIALLTGERLYCRRTACHALLPALVGCCC